MVDGLAIVMSNVGKLHQPFVILNNRKTKETEEYATHPPQQNQTLSNIKHATKHYSSITTEKQSKPSQ